MYTDCLKLIKLISKAGLQNDINLKNEISWISNSGIVCKIYKQPNLRTIVGLSIATEFRKVVVIDLKKNPYKINTTFKWSWLVWINSLQQLLQNQNWEEIISCIFNIWLSIFGAPSIFLSDMNLVLKIITKCVNH